MIKDALPPVGCHTGAGADAAYIPRRLLVGEQLTEPVFTGDTELIDERREPSANEQDEPGTRHEVATGRNRLNHLTIGTNASSADTASSCVKSFSVRLRLSSLIPLVLGACVLLPTTSPLQAKEFSMQDNQGQKPSNASSTTLPEGVFPPMNGYTNEELATAACQSVDKVFKENNIDPTLARESLFDLFNHLITAYQANDVDYQISTWYQKPYNDPAARAESVKAMAKEFNALTIRAAGDALIKSPLGNMSRDFQRSYLESAGAGVQSLIETLNKPGT